MRAPPPQDVNALFALAESAFVAGRIAEARTSLARVMRITGDHPAVLHLLALIEKREGNHVAAAAAFRRALAHAPREPQILNNYANLLDATGQVKPALGRYGDAIAASPAFVDPRLNRALLLARLGRPTEALADLDAAASLAPTDVRLFVARGAVLRDLDRLDEAAASLDAALAIEPRRITALAARARVSLDRGEADAVDRHRAALALQPADAELRMGLALAIEAQGGTEAIAMLDDLVAARPGWAEGHQELARMRSEAGDVGDATRSFDRAIAADPTDVALHRSHWATLLQAERFEDVLGALRSAARYVTTDDEVALLAEAVAASETGDRGRAEAAFDKLGDRPGAALPHARHALRIGDPARAAKVLERLVDADPSHMAGWAYLALAWRLLDDRRAAWLCDFPGIVGTVDLGLTRAEIAGLGVLLRSLHRTRAHPIGQSLRGGTQTRGRLFARVEPELRTLRERLQSAVQAHVAQLPPADPAHPLLRHRNASFSLAGSWSVRLRESGFHVHHIHSQGLLSSAFYVALPETMGGADTRDGWLELGAPPQELGLSLPPLFTVEPRVGRLALFPSYLFHGTRPFAAGERLTVAFDAQVA